MDAGMSHLHSTPDGNYKDTSDPLYRFLKMLRPRGNDLSCLRMKRSIHPGMFSPQMDRRRALNFDRHCDIDQMDY